MARSRVELFEQIRRDQRAGGSSIRSWPGGIGAGTGGRCARRWPARSRRRARRNSCARPRPLIGPYARVIDAWVAGRTGTCRASSGIPPGGCGSGAGRRARRHAGRGDGVAVCGPAAGRAGPGQGRGPRCRRRTAGRGGRGGLRRVPRQRGRDDAEAVAVRDAAVVLGRAFHVAFATQAQEAFLEGHVLALSISARRLPGPLRQPQAWRWCGWARAGTGRRPSGSSRCARITGSTRSSASGQGHEKGGVEGEIGRFRRRHLVPVPAAASLAALNQLIAAAGTWMTAG